MSRFAENAIALKIARRSVGRNRLQSALIIAIIALPLALAGLVLTHAESTKPTGVERVKYLLGDAKARYEIQQPPAETLVQGPNDDYLNYSDGQWPQDNQTPMLTVDQALPNLELVAISQGNVEFKTATGRGSLTVIVGDRWNEAFLGKGPVSLVSGHVPSSSNEVLVSSSALDRLGVSFGDSIQTTTGQSFKVVGVLENSSRNKYEDIVYAKTGAIKEYFAANTLYYQVAGVAPTWDQVKELNKKGVAVLSRDVLLNPPAQNEVDPSTVVSALMIVVAAVLYAPLALLPVLVLAGSAFSFGARRQTRTLAVLSSLGASKKTLRKVTLASGVWLGLLGGATGLGLGVAIEALFGRTIAGVFMSEDTWNTYPGFHVPWFGLGLALLGSVLLGLLTSLVPAIKASKVNVLANLRGTRTEGEVRVRTAVGALVLLIVGVGAIVASLLIMLAALKISTDFGLRMALNLIGVLLGFAGAVVIVISFILGTGWVLRGIRAVMSRLGTTANYAGKDLLYNRKRYAPVVASVLTVTFVATFVATFAYGPTKNNYDNYRYMYFNGQAGLEQGINSDGSMATSAQLEANRELIESTGAFDAVKVIDSTVSPSSNPLAFDNDGTIKPEYDAVTPIVVYDPAKTCYYTGLNPGSQKWLSEHATTMTSKDMKQPEGCFAVDNPRDTFVVGDVSTLRTIIMETNRDAEATLKNGGAVLFSAAYDYSGKAKISWLKPSDYNWSERNIDNAEKSVLLESYVVSKVKSESFAYTAMISYETAKKLDIAWKPTSILVTYSKPVPTAVTDELNGNGLYIAYGSIDSVLNPEVLAWIIILLASAFSLAATGIALGLSQIEARTDKRTLSSIGAPRSFRAGMVATQAFALTLAGSLLGAVTGMMLGTSMLIGLDTPALLFPWVQLAGIVLGVPAVAALAFWLFTPRSLKYEVRQALD